MKKLAGVAVVLLTYVGWYYLYTTAVSGGDGFGGLLLYVGLLASHGLLYLVLDS